MISRLRFFIPKKIAEFHSPYNAYIRINEEIGGRKLLVNGSPQSGPYIEKLWSGAFGAFHIQQKKNVQTMLVLGIAGGTVIQMMHHMNPYAHITGVDIDPMMVTIGKKYFGLDTIPHLQLVCSDAQLFVKQEIKKQHTYDCVIVDMSFGRVIPEFLLDETFLTSVKRIINVRGFSVINFLRELEYEKKSVLLQKKLQDIFPVVRDYGIYRNRFFFVSIV
jgi:spermidine synthase